MMINNFTSIFFGRKKYNILRYLHWRKKPIVALFILGFIVYSSIGFAQPDGEKLFKQSCGSCHLLTNDKLVGPGLKDITVKRKEDWLLKWIKSSSAFIKSGDVDAKAIFDKFNGMAMPDQNFSDEEIKSILAYVNTGGKSAIVAIDSTATSGATPVDIASQSGPISSSSLWILSSFIVAVFLMFLLLNNLNKTLKANGHRGIPIMNTPFSSLLKDVISKNKKIVTIILLFIILFGVKSCWDGLLGIGVSQGYQPDQPIKYSHKVHAGQNAIACQYCHFGAFKSKTAGVPPANVCMNCHKYIQSGTTTGKEEIAKIYKALDYNPETQVYGPNPKPIQWVRVHNLPDLAYFNHSQHVVAGQVACQTCHGQIQEMDVVKQDAPLTMGWCIDCHKKTEVKMDANPYYNEIHEKLKKRYKGQKITVDKIGGLDCAKCHY